MALNNLLNVPLTPVSVNTSATQTQLLSMLNSTASWNTLNNINNQTGTTYTVQLSDYGKFITFSNAAAITVTLPQQSTTATSAGFFCWILNLGTTPITFVIQGAETLIGNPGLSTTQQCKIERASSTSWSVFGNTGMVKINSVSANAAATVEFTNLNTNYNNYTIFIDSFYSSVAGNPFILRMSTDNGATYDSANHYGYQFLRSTFAGSSLTTASTAAASIFIKSGMLPIIAGLQLSCGITLYNPVGNNKSTVVTNKLASDDTATTGYLVKGGGCRYTLGPVNAIQFSITAATITGNLSLYGMTA